MGAMCGSQRSLEAGSTVKSPGATAGDSPFAVDDVLVVVKKFGLRGKSGKKIRLSVGDKLKVTEVGQYAAKVMLEGGDWEESVWLYKKDHSKVKNTAIMVGDVLVLVKKKANLRGQGVSKKLKTGDTIKVVGKEKGNLKVNGVDEDWGGVAWLYQKDMKKFEKYEPEPEVEEAPVVEEVTKPAAEEVVETAPAVEEEPAPAVVATEEEAPKAEAAEVVAEETQAETA